MSADETGRIAGAAPTDADTVIRARRIHVFDEQERVATALAVKDGKVFALGDDAEDLAPLVGPRTAVVDLSDQVLMPSFYDTHNHLLLTAVDRYCYLDLSTARSIDDLVELVAERARTAEPGTWIISSRRWSDTQLTEARLPTASELDKASPNHPVCLRRDGHVMVVNTRALQLAGWYGSTVDPPGGTLGRNADGTPNGQLFEFAAYQPVADLLPVLGRDERVDALGRMCADYNARGITAVRDPGVAARGDLDVYEALRRRGGLSVRSRVMLFVRFNESPTIADAIAKLDSWGVRSDFGDDLLRIDGIKTSIDGGIEGAALDAPYESNPDHSGHLLADADELEELALAAVDLGYRVGCHVVGGRAVSTAITAFEAVLRQRPTLPPAWLSLEHAFFADADMRRRVVDAGIGVTVQFPIVAALGGQMLTHWGPERSNEAVPIRSWCEDGAIVSGGTDSNVSPFDPLLAIWGTITRRTSDGEVLGASQAVDRRTAFALYTIAGPKAFGEAATRGPLLPGRLADFVAFDTDPLECDVDLIPELAPTLTVLGGRAVHDPHGRFPGAGL